ncbi:DUF1543 domain-containing protein [Rhizosphaericola mali]|uniref:DUF1543 domain-containing protein n=1 Tax=Rhizosphaericola mali TaxID=2545455 RepID=A0A5P2G8A7_9BACT|nr:DUF1543 domain-containing protein [Rhizosphaericola mali]QES90132.1 DUF1543 domain-containing protein [Rhizosphaericola mali]
MKLFMILLGGRPEGRWTEQHDILFGIGEDLKSLLPQIKASWREAASVGRLHIDAWREVNFVNGFHVEVKERDSSIENDKQLFFINLGGYRENEFDEFHYKMIIVADNKSEAIKLAKKSSFFSDYNMAGANSHIDDKYGVDVDDIYAIDEILPSEIKEKYSIQIRLTEAKEEDKMHLGYLKLSLLK